MAFVFLFSCGDSSDPEIDQAAIDEQVIVDYLAANNITSAVKHDSGVYYEILTENPTGNIQQINGSILTIYYEAKVLDGDIIEVISASALNDPAKLKQGVGAIFPVGLDIGLALMKEDEIFRFYLPSTLAYGSNSYSSIIPENAIIQIEVELISIQNEEAQLIDENNLINNYIITNDLNNTVDNPLDPVVNLITGEFYKRLSAGITDNVPIQGDLIRIQYTGTFLDGMEFDATSGTPFDYNFATGSVIPGLDNGIAQMEHGERALIIIPSSLAYKESAMFIPSYLGGEFVANEIIPTYATIVPPFQVLIFDVTLQ